MKILLTGATGLLGRRVLAMLRARGENVVPVGRTRAAETGALEADLRDAEAIARLPSGVDCVVHLAALLPAPQRSPSPSEWLEHNALATLQLLEWSAKNQVRSFVYGSTWSVYGDPSRQGPVGEATPPQPADLYSVSKLAGELYCEPFAFAHGLRTSVLRFSYIFGPGMRDDTVVMQFLRSAARGSPLRLFGGGRDMTDLVHVDDAARAVTAACDRPCGVCNIGGGKPVTIRDLAEASNAVAGGRGRLMDEPGSASRRLYLAIQRARDTLDWRPQVALADGLRALAREAV